MRAATERSLSGWLAADVESACREEPSGQWLEHSIRFSVGEVDGSSAGSGLVLAKFSEVLFVETLRRYINELPPDQIGWLAGARDPDDWAGSGSAA